MITKLKTNITYCLLLYFTFFSIGTILAGCASSPMFRSNDCLIPKSSSGPQDIIQIVAVGDGHYKVFTYFLSNGKVIQAQDYQNRICSEIDSAYVKVECPAYDGTFSPDKYLNKKKNP